jgi:hypothetical protein
MGEIVHCDVCGKLFSSSHLKAHKRLAHQRSGEIHPNAPLNERDLIRMIESLFNALSADGKKSLAKQLLERVDN